MENLMKSQTNATSVIMHSHSQAICRDIWKFIVEKNLTNATNATLHSLGQAIWGHISKHTVEKGQTNVISVTMPHLRHVIWRDILKHTGESNQTHVQTTAASFGAGNFRQHFKTHRGKKNKGMQSLWLCGLSGKPSKNTHEQVNNCKWLYDKLECNLKGENLMKIV